MQHEEDRNSTTGLHCEQHVQTDSKDSRRRDTIYDPRTGNNAHVCIQVPLNSMYFLPSTF